MPKKRRTEIPSELAAQILFLSDRICCVCRRQKPVQIHHIDEDPSNNALENLSVLCLDCHRETQIRGGFDRKLDAAQIILYRDQWLATVAKLRGEVVDSYQSLLTTARLPLSDPASPNVTAVRPWHTRVVTAARSALVEQKAGSTIALIAPFRNDPTPDRPIVSAAQHLVATVRLSIIPDSSVTGHWLGSESPYVNLAPGQQHLLVVAVIGEKFASLVSDGRAQTSGAVEFKHFWFRPSTVNETEFTISLSNEGRFLGEYTYIGKLAPFPDIQFMH
jgi:hypothetical protein